MECLILASNCIACDFTLNRQLVNKSCVPVTHYFDNGVNISALPCDYNCS